MAGPGFAFALTFESKVFTFGFIDPAEQVGAAPRFSVTVKTVEGNVEAALEAAVTSRRRDFALAKVIDHPAKLSASKAVEFETVAKSYDAVTLERFAAVEGKLLVARCERERAEFEAFRQRCVAILDAIELTKTAPQGPAVSGPGFFVTMPPSLLVGQVYAFKETNDDMEDFIEVRLNMGQWPGDLAGLAVLEVQPAYVTTKSRMSRRSTNGLPSVYFDNSTGGAPMIRQLQRRTVASGRGYVVSCETDVGSFAKNRSTCLKVLDSIRVGP